MKAQLKKRPESRRIRVESGGGNRKANAVLGEEYFRKAKAEQLNAKYERAIELYMLAVTCKPAYFQAYCNLGYCYRVLGKFAEAKRSYLSALHSNPSDPITRYNLANLYRVIGQNQLAIQEYTQVIGLKQGGASVGSLYLDSLINIGICFKNKGQFEDAIRVYRRVLEEEPNQLSATFNLAVCILHSIQDKNSPLFHKFHHQRATEAQSLFNSVLAANPNNLMAHFCLAKVSVLLDPTPPSLEAAIASLKELLADPKCDIKDDVGQEIGRYLSQLKKFDESARYYEDSVASLARRSRTNSQQVQNIFETFSQQNIQQDSARNEFLTEAEGIRLIESGAIKKAQESISQLEDGLLKHTLELALQLKISQYDADNIDNAIELYKRYFDKSENQLPFTRLSLEAHKAIGKVLALQKDYEGSIRHYQHIATHIKADRSVNSAKLHSQLGEGFQQAGNREKALEEYKKGMEIEPDNYSLSYSMGNCLYENGSLEEAKEIFQRIIQRIRSDSSLSAASRQLYQTDCLIICALCTTQHSQATFNLFTEAFQHLQNLQASREGAIQMEEQNLLLFYLRICELYEEKIYELLPDDPLFSQFGHTLIAIYRAMLELTCCPDRDEVLVNVANISYQLGLFATAADTYSQITDSRHLPAISLALAYAHILEPVLALKYAQQACQAEPKEAINAFCLEVLQWIYLGVQQGHWNTHLPALRRDLFYLRNQYGVGLLDKLSEAINAPDYQPKGKDKLLQNLAKHQERMKSRSHLLNLKFQHIEELRRRFPLDCPPQQSSILSPQVLKLCFSKSNQTGKDLERLVEHLGKMAVCGRESEFCESALHLFVYYNQIDSQPILETIRRLSKRSKQHASILSSHSSHNPQIYSIYPDFTNAKEAIAVLKEWETVLESATHQTLKAVEEAYYDGKIVQPLEAEYHFPRHSNLLEEDETFSKFITIALSAFKYDKKLVCKGSNVQQLRNDLIREFQTHFKRFLKDSQLHPITISDSFLPLTLYAVLDSKQDCQSFLNDLARRVKAPEIVLHECEEAIVVVNRLVRVRCRWNNPYQTSSILSEVMDSITENPLFIVNQAILKLPAAIPVISQDSPEAKKYISLDSTLHF